MCGIAGFVGRGDKKNASNMISQVRYRGPNDKGVLVKSGVGLAHARLSILDTTKAGHQPMVTEDGSAAIVFNGEIYNFKKLKKELLKKGYEFNSETDTEVILKLYQDIGKECFGKLNGMFAFGLYDFNQEKLFLARDRMGQKPLYWAKFGDDFIFGSELKSLMAHPSFKKELNLESINKYLLYEYIPTPNSMFKNTYKLEPGTFLEFKDGEINKEKFWQPNFKEKSISFESAKKSLKEKIESSVKSRLVSDVPLGIFLSGGLDSSTVAYFAQKNTDKNIKTFSVGFEEESFDETSHAKKIADFLETDHHHKLLTSKKVKNSLSNILDKVDEPLADASIVPTYLLSEFTSKEITVALGGDGADELFAGYPTFKAESVAKFYKKIPVSFKKLIENVVETIPASDKNFGLPFKLRKFFCDFEERDRYRHHNWLGSFDREERSKLFKKEVWKNLESKNEYEELDKYMKESKQASFHNQLLYLYMRTYLMDGVLTKVDRASMYNGLEVRAPFLDYNLIDFVNSLPYNFKYRNFTTKYILKKAMEDILPRDIVYRKKKGFGLPIARWFKGDLKEFLNSILSKETIDKPSLFNYNYINKLKQQHFQGKKDNRKKLWTLLILQIWLNQYSI